MLAVVLAAGLFPNTGTVRADTSCPYGGCTTTSTIPTWELVSILVLIAAGAIAAALFLMRRRRPPPGAPVQAWQEGPSTAAAAAPAYLETPEDVGHAPPSVSPGVGPAIGGAAVGGAAAAQAEPDIDSLMAELDKISGEILKKPSKKGKGGPDDELPEEDEKS
jgi:hypothetical protein